MPCLYNCIKVVLQHKHSSGSTIMISNEKMQNRVDRGLQIGPELEEEIHQEDEAEDGALHKDLNSQRRLFMTGLSTRNELITDGRFGAHW